MTRPGRCFILLLMQIAVITDIHGNWTALEAVMAEIQRLGADEIICLGDVINPLPSSRRTVEFLLEKEIPIIRGNHEDYIITSHENPANPINYSDQFKPIHLVSQTFDQALVNVMKTWPLNLRRENVLFCHASPHSNTQGWRYGFHAGLQKELLDQHAEIILCGHWHDPQTTNWNGIDLVTVGSVGLPLAGTHEAEFLVLSSSQRGWEHQHLKVPFDFEPSIREFVDSGWFAQGGPMAWLLYRELETARRHVSSFFMWAKRNQRLPSHEVSWTEAIQEFLQATETWDEVASLLMK